MLDSDLLDSYQALGAVGIMGLICLLGIWLSSKNFNRLIDIQTAERRTWTETTGKAVERFEKTAERMIATVEALDCVKYFKREEYIRKPKTSHIN